jgi:hypothetical protein
MEYFLAEAQNEESIDICLSLDSVYSVQQLTNRTCLIASPVDAMADMYTTLNQFDFMALAPVTTFSEASYHNVTMQAGRQAEKDDFVNAVDGFRATYAGALADLTGEGSLDIQTRCSFSTQHTVAANYINDYFNGLGLSSTLQPFRFGSTNTQNVLAVQTGSDPNLNNQIVVIGAHYDSTSPTCATVAPGAVDNGGGCTMVMAIAAAAVKLSFPFTVHYVCFGGEEQGLYGSSYYVSQSNPSLVRASLIADMIGYSNRYYGVTLEGTSNRDIQRLMGLAADNARTYSPDLTVAQSTNSFGSDHVPFQRAGIPCFLFIQQDDTVYPCYHRTCDTIDQMNYNQAMDITLVAAATLWDAANGYF